MPIDNTSQIRGLLLEEMLLHLLRKTGYRVISDATGDDTLVNGRAGIEVKGRGANHQIDAIADFLICHPFSHPQRLLVEAKCYKEGKNIGIDKARNAVGVLKDVCEYWVTSSPTSIAHSRYHYQYALFSATSYTKETERYAFAHDIYLIPLAASSFLKPAIDAIRDISSDDFPVRVRARRNSGQSLKQLREFIRRWLTYGDAGAFPNNYTYPLIDKLNRLCQECFRIDFALLAVLGQSFPVFLVPNPDISLEGLDEDVDVRIYWDDNGWYLRNRQEEDLFSFDLPQKLFNLYATDGRLDPKPALYMKANEMSNFTAFATINDNIRVIKFRLDQNWLEEVKARLD